MRKIGILILCVILSLCISACEEENIYRQNNLEETHFNDKIQSNKETQFNNKPQSVEETQSNDDSIEIFSIGDVHYRYNYYGDYYRVCKYENDDCELVAQSNKKPDYEITDNNFWVYDESNRRKYVIRFDEESEKIEFEEYCTDIIKSEKYSYTCYISGFNSITIFDDSDNSMIMSKYIPEDADYSDDFYKEAEDFDFNDNWSYGLDRGTDVDEFAFINDHIFFYYCKDYFYNFVAIDLDKKLIAHKCYSNLCKFNKDNGIIFQVTWSAYFMEIGAFNELQMKKRYSTVDLYNIYTDEHIHITKNFSLGIPIEYYDDKCMKYKRYGKEVCIDISDYTDKNRKNIINECLTIIRENYETNDIEHDQLRRINNRYFQVVKTPQNTYTLYSMEDNECKLLQSKSSNINLYSFKDGIYAYVDANEDSKFMRFSSDSEKIIYCGKLDDISFEEIGEYVTLVSNEGELLVLDKNGDVIYKKNLYAYSARNDIAIDEIKISMIDWDENYKYLYILTSKDDMASNIFQVDIKNDKVVDYAGDINSVYDSYYIDTSDRYIIYNNIIQDAESNDIEKWILSIKYLDTGEVVKIFENKIRPTYFNFYDDQIKYSYTIDDEYFNDSYNIEVAE